jgi:hypothetical protein
MGEQMRGASCCATVQGEFAKAPIAPPGSSSAGAPILADVVWTPQTAPTLPPILSLARAYSSLLSTLPQHPLQI